jgi:hypothetical protein
MDVKSNSTQEEFVDSDELIDPDDAPELTDEFFDNAIYMIGDQVVSEKEFRDAADAIIREGERKRRATSR